MRLIIALLACTLLACMPVAVSVGPDDGDPGPPKAFPGAEGFGTETRAGRGGAILRVTTLADSGTGSLRAAIESTGARTIVFETSGTITLASDLRITSPYVTIAGQTAPAPGIQLAGWGIRITTHDVLIQHLAVRPGDEGKTLAPPAYDNVDCIQLLNGAYNVVIDHVSMAWSIDENLSTWPEADGTADNITISDCLIAEGLHNSLHSEQPHSKGLLLGVGTGKVTVRGTLMAHNWDRNPQLQGPTEAQVINNLVYEGAGGAGFPVLTDPYAGGPIKVSFQGNVFKETPLTTATYTFAIGATVAAGSELFQTDSLWLNEDDTEKPVRVKDSKGGVEVGTPPVSLSGLTILPAAQVKAAVLSHAGARPGARDATDARIVAQVQTGTGGQIDSVSDVGRPVYAVNQAAFDAGSDPHGDDDGDGYTNLEELLHQAAAALE